MKKMKTKNKCLVTSLAIIAMLMMSVGVKAQSVKVDAHTGSLVTALTYEGETGWAAGLSGMWRHEQLALTMTTSDEDVLTESGEVNDPSAALGVFNDNLIIAGGHMPTFLVVSLPNGYRFTGYEMVLVNNLGGEDICPTAEKADASFHNMPTGNNNYLYFYETERWTGDAHPRDNQNYNNTDPLGTTVLATATATDGSGSRITVNSSNKGKEYKIKRESQSDTDMGNQLYFRVTKNFFYYGLTIKSFTLYFTAEGTFTVSVKPSRVNTNPVSMTVSPFKTNKIDIGKLDYYNKDGVSHYSYDHDNVQDLEAFNYFYQGIKEGEDAQNLAVRNGVPADVARTRKIYQMENDGEMYYGLKNGIYYVEPPVEITNSSDNPAPIGYRIVGARINYALGKEATASHVDESTKYYITYESNGTTYYLGQDCRFGESPVEWQKTPDNYVHIGNTYLTCNSNYSQLISGTSNSSRRLRIDENNRLYITRNNGWSSTTYYLHTAAPSVIPPMASNTSGLALWTIDYTPEHDIPAFSPEAQYKIQFYDRTGTKITTEGGLVTVNAAHSSDFFDMGLMNNDAVMFEIIDIGDEQNVENGMALVTVDLDLQALDPYIDKMDIVCHDENNRLELTQSFTADNFSVSGGRFVFYVPDDYKHDLLTFTFANLYSKYGDATYYDGTGKGSSRYSFVTSEYFLGRIDGDNNDGLYEEKDENNPDHPYYDPDHPYNGYPGTTVNGVEKRDLSKIETSTAGKFRFKFNNAENLTDDDYDYLEEYPFSVPIYKNTDNPGDQNATPRVDASTEKGSFIDCKLKAIPAEGENVQSSGTYYVFTADETRWNIAPTTAWQHRFYAFYRMEIVLEARTFTPDFKAVKIYDKTLYTDENGQDQEDSMWGVVLDVKDLDDEGQKVPGYFTYQEIINIINSGREAILWKAGDDIPSDKQIGDVRIPAIPKLLDEENGITGPKSMKHILYVDGSNLHSMLNSSEGTTVKYLKDLQDELSKNAIVFLPENTKSTNNNVAYKTSTGSFRAGKDIVLTDKYPFFSPHDITVEYPNVATYKRELSGPTTTLAKFATVVLPFTLKVSNGLHKNDTDDAIEFNLRTMAGLATPTDAQTSNNNYYSDANFTKILGETSVANMPYMVEVISDNGEDYSFIASQKGSNIVASPTVTDGSAIGKTYFAGETVENKKDANVSTLTNYGSYSGAKIHRDNNVYYFNRNKYVSSLTMARKYTYVNARPFRAYYSPVKPEDFYDVQSTNSPSAGSKMIGFNIVYDLFSDDGGITTSLTETSKPRVMTINTSKGSMLITAAEDVPVKIMSVNGLSVDSFNMNAGEQRQVNLPSGIYIVNNTKILVK